MKFDKNLIKSMRASIVTSRTIKEAVEDIDIESAMEEFDTNGFKRKLAIDDLPQSIQNLMRFPYIPNQNVIDSIKYNEDLKQILVQFKLQFKKLSDAFISKANTDKLIGSLTNHNTDRIVSFGLNNMRMIVVFQLVTPLENGKPKEEDLESPAEPTEENITEGIDDFHSTEDNYIPPRSADLVDFYKANPDESKLRRKIQSGNFDQEDLMNLYWQLSKVNKPKATVDDVVGEIVKKNPISESTASTVALEQVLTDMAVSIHNTFGDAQTDEERKELKKIWSDKIKEIEKNLK